MVDQESVSVWHPASRRVRPALHRYKSHRWQHGMPHTVAIEEGPTRSSRPSYRTSERLRSLANSVLRSRGLGLVFLGDLDDLVEIGGRVNRDLAEHLAIEFDVRSQ